MARLDRALLVPEAAVQGYDGGRGRVWTVEDGRLQRRVVDFRPSHEDARLEIVGGLARRRARRHPGGQRLPRGPRGPDPGGGGTMNLAYRDIRHNLGRFLLTCLGLGLLLGVVLAMIGIYRGLVVDALTIARAPAVDLWVVEADTRGPFAEASRIPGDTREAVARIAGVAAAPAASPTRPSRPSIGGGKLRLYVIGYELARPGRPARDRRGPGHRPPPLRDRGRPHERP